MAGGLAAALAFMLAGFAVASSRARHWRDRFDALAAHQEREAHDWRDAFDHLQREMRDDLARTMSALRVESRQHQDGLRDQLARDAVQLRDEQGRGLERFATNLSQQWQQLGEANDRRLHELRHTLETRLQALQAENAGKLDEMRRLVDDKLQATLEQRLGESFRLVSQQLEAVHRGLGDMRQLAAGVGDLQRVLVNVKARGTWGEVQLTRLIEDLMTPDQYAYQVRPVPGRSEVVECAIRLPGRDGDMPVWLPIDAKFPKEAFERLHDAHERADEDAMRTAGAALERAVETEARRIASKYVSPPHTTDFAVMFLATESLYAEVLRRPGLFDRLLALRVTVAGPSTLAAMLNSLQMGFRTLAIEQRSAEVWQVLRAVKTEFGKFGDALAQVRKSLESASSRIGQTETRTRVMLRNLRTVEALPADTALPWPDNGEEDEAMAHAPGSKDDRSPASEAPRSEPPEGV